VRKLSFTDHPCRTRHCYQQSYRNPINYRIECAIGTAVIIQHGHEQHQHWCGAFIRNSVIGSGSVVGPGAVIGPVEVERASAASSQTSSTLGAALGDYAVVGANSTIKSGTVIGSRTIIGEGVLADGIYGSNQTVTLVSALDIKPRHDHT
jgi:acetyltransferase-like isoleucine patch superfamily enzyme